MMRRFLRRFGWFFFFLLLAGAGWFAAFEYLRDFRKPDVPLVDTPQDVVEAMLDLAEVRESDFLVDLGSGDGRFLIAAGRRGAKSLGIELVPETIETSRANIRNAEMESKAKVIHGDIFRSDFSDATVVTMFLTIQLNAQLRPQFDRLKPGSRIVSHSWSMPGAKPAKTIVVPSRVTRADHTVHLWVTPIAWE